MLRKLIVLVCLISFAPVSAGAQELAAALLPTEVTAQGSATQPANPVKVMVAANDRTDSAATAATPERETKSRPGCTLRDFFDIHFGGYRWLWWAGAAAALVAIHVAAGD